MSTSVWKGHIAFGVVSFPVKLCAAARSQAVSFHQLHQCDHSRVKQVLCCQGDAQGCEPVATGATNCATGKFFNLRRFTISRFDEPNGGGGGQLGYWFEEALLAFLRQSDVLRVRARELASAASTDNPFSASIVEAIPAKQAWVALGWRQFLYWFADAEFRLRSGAVSADELVALADGNWAGIEKSKPPLLMEERQNDGSWVRQWLRALVEFPYFR